MSDGLAHLLSHQLSVSRFVIPEDSLEIAKLLKAALNASMTLRVLVTEALIRALYRLIYFSVANGFKRPIQLVVFGIHRSVNTAHLSNF